MRQPARARLVPVLAVALLVLAAVVAASLATPQLHRSQLPQFGPTAHPQPTQTDTIVVVVPSESEASGSGEYLHLPAWVGVVALIGLGLLLLTTAAVLIWFVLRNRVRASAAEVPEVVPQRQAREAVLAAVDAGLADLDEGEPRAAVIACWVRLEEAAAAAGTPREPGDTPAELVLRLLAEHQVSSAVLYDLAAVYRLARYATHDIDTGMRDQARAALRQLRHELSHPVAPPDPATAGLSGGAP